MLDFILFHAIHLLLSVFLVQTLLMIWRSGMFDLGHFAYLALGAYFAASLSLMLPAESWFLENKINRQYGISIILIMACLSAAVIGGVAWVFGKISTKFSGDYFAVATLVFSEAILRLLSVWGLTGGDRGFEMPYLFARRTIEEATYFNLVYFAITLAMNFAVYFGFRRFYNSHYGLLIDAVRLDTLATEARGVDAQKVKHRIYVLCSAFAAFTGVIYLNFATLITPNDFSFINSLPIAVCVILGNHKPLRAIFFCVALYVIYEFAKVRFLGILGPTIGEFVASWKEAIYGVALLISVFLANKVRLATKGNFSNVD